MRTDPIEPPLSDSAAKDAAAPPPEGASPPPEGASPPPEGAPPEGVPAPPEGAPARPEPATLFRRLAALVYDSFLVAALAFAFTFVLVVPRGREIEPETPWYFPALVGIAFAFYGWFWTRGGQTLGMQAWRIRVTAADGGPVRWRHAALRFFAAWLSALPLGLGFWWMLLDAEKRTWHDRLSGTRTIRVRG